MLVKLYGPSSEGEKIYSPAGCIGAVKHQIEGSSPLPAGLVPAGRVMSKLLSHECQAHIATGLRMGRPREFNEMTALAAAVDCFWERGYEATSVRDLAASMGLTAPSLYNAFGDKQALFVRALERYLDCTTRGRLSKYETSLPPKQAIRKFFAEIIDHSVNDRQRKGCFLVNSALEVAPHQSKLRAVIAEQFGEIEGFFKRCILAAQADGTAPRGVNANDGARLLLGVLLGIRVLARSAPSRPLLEGAVRPALALLDLPHRKNKTR
jgi:TetR/AcrR family transcriptional regulator, transcriptional repressor for nem operon